jgi:hypothetical protein
MEALCKKTSYKLPHGSHPYDIPNCSKKIWAFTPSLSLHLSHSHPPAPYTRQINITSHNFPIHQYPRILAISCYLLRNYVSRRPIKFQNHFLASWTRTTISITEFFLKRQCISQSIQLPHVPATSTPGPPYHKEKKQMDNRPVAAILSLLLYHYLHMTLGVTPFWQ